MRDVIFVFVVLAIALLFAPACSNSDTQSPDAGDANASHVCYEPLNPLRAYACGTEADCSNCPASCDVAGFDAGAGECKP